jgi:putative DNA methylase
MTDVISPKKLIEVALPLDAINAASALEKQPFTRKHPRSLHIWWARRPLAAARAVIFGQLVHDPEDLWRCQNPGVEPKPQNKTAWTKSRDRLFKIIRDLVLWENTTNEDVLNAARNAIRESWLQTCELNKNHPQAKELFDPKKMPGLHDPFAGGGAIPLEAQRLGLEAYASDLNPVAVLINKAMIEIPPKFAGRAPVHPSVKKEASTVARPWKGAEGLAEDVRRYGQWMRDEAEKRIGHLYPKIEITKEMAAERPDLKPLVGQKLTVIAWLWARTVKSPNPAYSHIDVPLASTFVLSSKEGKEAYVEPVIKKDGYEFTVKVGKPPAGAQGGTTAGKRQAFRCLLSNAPIGYDHIRTEGKAGRMQQRLMAIVAESSSGRVYLSPTTDHEKQAASANPTWVPENKLPDNPRDFKTPNYGMSTFGELFTNRQLVALTTFSDLVGEAREHIERDAVAVGMPNDGTSLESGGTGAKAYAEAVITYLGIATSKWTDMSNALCSWNITNQNITHLFNKHAIPMAWDFAELSPFSAVGPWISVVESIFNLFESIPSLTRCLSSQRNASAQTMSRDKFISTDPPYYDNVGYADLSDFFYVWLRRSLREVFPDLLSTISVPKAEELVATPYRHGTKEKAEAFFLDGMTKAMHNLAEQAHPCAPVTIYYAFKQSDSEEIGTNNTGWETFLDAVMKAGFSITGTWPMRTERAARAIGIGTKRYRSQRSRIFRCSGLQTS